MNTNTNNNNNSNTASNSSDAPLFHGPRAAARRMHRSDSIPEHSETTPTAGAGVSASTSASIEELLLRHSSPLFHRSTGGAASGEASAAASAAVVSPQAQSQAQRHTTNSSSPSPLRLNRPRSNPRSRTPMRISEGYSNQNDNDTQNEGREERDREETTEARRITIRLGSGSGAGSNTNTNTNTASYGTSRRTRHDHPVRPKSKKQGPSHRKARRWNNDNFVNLAAELSLSSSSSGGKGSSSAAVEALLRGSAEASQHASVFDPTRHESRAMNRFRDDAGLRERFFDGAIGGTGVPRAMAANRRRGRRPPTPLERFYRIEPRLRRIVTKACTNSCAASGVVRALEDYLATVYHRGRPDERSPEEWRELLLRPPTVAAAPARRRRRGTESRTDDRGTTTTTPSESESPSQTTGPEKRTVVAEFLFDADSSTGGFHRLLLHGVCQFHGLRATSSTTTATEGDGGRNARVLSATGTFSEPTLRLVDFIMERQQGGGNGSNGTVAAAAATTPESS